MRKPNRKMGPLLIQRLRGQLAAARECNRTLAQELKVSGRQVKHLEMELSDYSARLEEARRRTIPCNDGSEVNFLPLGIEIIEMKRDVREVQSASAGSARAIITASGELVYHSADKKG